MARGSISRGLIVSAGGLAAIALAGQVGFAAPALPSVTGDDWSIGRALGGAANAVSGLLSLPLFVGIALGYVGNEFGRVAWSRGVGAWHRLVGLSSFAAQYGAIAVALAAVLYFI